MRIAGSFQALSRIGRFGASLLVMATAAFTLAGCNEGRKAAAPPALVVALPVHPDSGAPGGIAVRYPVEVAARYSNPMSFRVPGKLIERRVRIGDSVKKGEVVARLDPVDAQKQAASARAALEAAEHRLVFARQQLDRDNAQAEQNLIAANARIGLARAAYYPSISLTGFLGTESTTLAGLFDPQARAWQFAGSISQTLFNAGRTRSQVGIARAREQQALAQYQSAIQNAFKDALDALVAQRKAREAMEAEQARIVALEAALRLAQLRYDNGVASLLDVLIAERSMLEAQLNRVEAQRAQLAAAADLFKAMGGGWNGLPAAVDSAGD